MGKITHIVSFWESLVKLKQWDVVKNWRKWTFSTRALDQLNIKKDTNRIIQILSVSLIHYKSFF